MIFAERPKDSSQPEDNDRTDRKVLHISQAGYRLSCIFFTIRTHPENHLLDEPLLWMGQENLSYVPLVH